MKDCNIINFTKKRAVQKISILKTVMLTIR